MARASVRTLLPIDRWAAILGLEPRHFNGVQTALAPSRSCHQPWMQYSWQDSDRIGREDVAMAVAQAESDIATALRFLPRPDWLEDVNVQMSRSHDTLTFPGIATVRGMYPSITVPTGHFLRGGIRASTLIGTASIGAGTMSWSDLDVDGYDETATLVLPTTVTDVDEIRAYFPSHADEDEWEIRPLRSVSIAGGNVTIEIDRHLLVLPDLWEAINAAAVDGDVDANFLTSVSVYRVYNNPSQQALMMWERVPGDCGCGQSSCPSCAFSTFDACLQSRDPRLGIVNYQPATWSDENEEFSVAIPTITRRPERVHVWYESGYTNTRTDRPRTVMDPVLERIIVMHSITMLDRPICSCNNIESFIERWREDRGLIATDGGRYQLARRALNCPWGTREGSIWAWERVQRFALGQGVRM